MSGLLLGRAQVNGGQKTSRQLDKTENGEKSHHVQWFTTSVPEGRGRFSFLQLLAQLPVLIMRPCKAIRRCGNLWPTAYFEVAILAFDGRMALTV